eukprot:676874_1
MATIDTPQDKELVDMDLNGMEMYEDVDMLDCTQLNVESELQFYDNSVMEIVKGAIEEISYAVKHSILYDLRKELQIQNKEEKKEMRIPVKYSNCVSEYQIIIELELLLDKKQNDDDMMITIGALIPKGYRSINDDCDSAMWFDSLHNLLLKQSKLYQQLFNARIQKQLKSLTNT